MARLYATAADVHEWLGDETATVTAAALRRASLLVEQATSGALYRVDPVTGLPLDAGVAGAMRDAVCAHVEAWISAGDLTGAGLAPAVTSASIGGVSFSMGPDVTAPAPGRLVDDALLILDMAGLLTAVVWAV